MTFCECGCGQEVKSENRFMVGHASRGVKKGEAVKRGWITRRINQEIKEGKRPAPVLSICLCGCGQKVTKIGNKYIHGHCMRVNPPMQNPESAKKQGITMKLKWKCPTQAMMDGRGKMAETLFGRTKEDYEYIRKVAEKKRGRTKETDDGIRRQSEKMRGRGSWNKGKKGFNAGPKNGNWKGGISFLPYCEKFNEPFKESIREKYNRTCFLCPTTEAEQMQDMVSRGKRPHKLSVHHITYNKDCLCDDLDCEFVPLCIKCHGMTSYNREYWMDVIMRKIKVVADVLLDGGVN